MMMMMMMMMMMTITNVRNSASPPITLTPPSSPTSTPIPRQRVSDSTPTNSGFYATILIEVLERETRILIGKCLSWSEFESGPPMIVPDDITFITLDEPNTCCTLSVSSSFLFSFSSSCSSSCSSQSSPCPALPSSCSSSVPSSSSPPLLRLFLLFCLFCVVFGFFLNNSAINLSFDSKNIIFWRFWVKSDT